MARKLNNEHLRNMAESVADVPEGRMLNNDYLRIIAENFSGGGGGGGTGTVDASSIVGVIPAENLPSYVDDVLEYPSQSALPATGETGKIYVTTDTNTTYRWSGSAYVPISNPLDYATQAEAEAGTESTHVMTPLRTKQAIDANAYSLPLMSPTTRGGAKLGHGLTIEDGALGIGSVTDPTDAGPIVELTAKGWAEQDTTVGKNLLPNLSPKTTNGITLSYDAEGYIVLNGTATAAAAFGVTTSIQAGTYTLSCNNPSTASGNTAIRIRSDGSYVVNSAFTASNITKSVTVDADIDLWQIRVPEGETLTNFRLKPQLELGSTATDYEPYTGGAPSPSPSYPQEIRRVTGHTIAGKTGRYVDILVTHDGTTTTIPIPLPSRGWVAALPDGTADILALDGAGGYVWELATEEVVFDGSNDEEWLLRFNNKNCYTTSLRPTIARPSTNTAVANVLCDSFGRTNLSALETNVGIAMSIDGDIHISDKTDGDMTLADFTSWLAENPVTVLYPLSAPTTESGYVSDMPTVPVHAAISSVDLHDLTVRCCADEGAAEIAAAWGRRYESRIAALEDAVATLVAAGA